MKKISTLILTALAAITVSAAARPPQVLLRTASNYDVRIDGRLYKTDNTAIPYLNPGVHTLEVYRVGAGLFGKRKTLVSSQQFTLQYNDVSIDVNPNGQAWVSVDRYNGNGRGNGNGNWNTGNGNRGNGYGNAEKRDRDDDNRGNGNGGRRDRNDDNRGYGQNYPNRDYGNDSQYNNGQYNNGQNNGQYSPYRNN